MSKIRSIQNAFFTTVVFIFTTVVLIEKISDRATTVVFYYSGFKIIKITLLKTQGHFMSRSGGHTMWKIGSPRLSLTRSFVQHHSGSSVF